MVSGKVKLSSFLRPQKCLALMQSSEVELVSPELIGDKLSITGCKELVLQVRHFKMLFFIAPVPSHLDPALPPPSPLPSSFVRFN